jgi:hypothetical protein
MITNADDFIPVNRIDGRLTPFNTGKVQIGLLYQPRPPEMTSSEELVQAALLGTTSMHRPAPMWPVVLGSAIVASLLIFLVG